MEDLIGYDEIIEKSMRSVIFYALKKIEKNGLQGKHYFVITFLTKIPGVVISKELREKYPEEMTIVIQYQYSSLVVTEESFKISLSFNGKLEKIAVPYRSITSFADPSMNFAVKFSLTYSDFEDLDLEDESLEKSLYFRNQASKQNKKSSGIDLSAKIISLDAFRKNQNPDNSEND